ncbi:hypothetical protein D3H65_30015 [Paraflavitalea soli]|uniref:Uncharacterized protein n=1 Tax=Paraflavitalea soli TaxID=2315862 RepID=A0A3B7MTX3_9BACT|nr:hypothetical protein D3H65_30015 [Paraflavitalea soli]
MPPLDQGEPPLKGAHPLPGFDRLSLTTAFERLTLTPTTVFPFSPIDCSQWTPGPFSGNYSGASLHQQLQQINKSSLSIFHKQLVLVTALVSTRAFFFYT